MVLHVRVVHQYNLSRSKLHSTPDSNSSSNLSLVSTHCFRECVVPEDGCLGRGLLGHVDYHHDREGHGPHSNVHLASSNCEVGPEKKSELLLCYHL